MCVCMYVFYIYDPSSKEAEAEESLQAQGQPGFHILTLPEKVEELNYKLISIYSHY